MLPGTFWEGFSHFFTMDEADFWLLYVPVVLWLIWV